MVFLCLVECFVFFRDCALGIQRNMFNTCRRIQFPFSHLLPQIIPSSILYILFLNPCCRMSKTCNQHIKFGYIIVDYLICHLRHFGFSRFVRQSKIFPSKTFRIEPFRAVHGCTNDVNPVDVNQISIEFAKKPFAPGLDHPTRGL